jgi:hypothetical protein
MILSEEVKEYVWRKKAFGNNNGLLYGVVWGQCSPTVRANIEAEDNFTSVQTSAEGVKLLGLVKKVVYEVDDWKYNHHNLWQAQLRLYNVRQQRHETNPIYYRRVTRQPML